MKPFLHLQPDPAAVAKAAAAFIADRIQTTLATQPRFTLALSGGSTPKALHQLLASSPYKETIEWNRVHIFWGDERYLPFEDERNNAGMAFETLLNHVPVPKEQIHIMQTNLPDPREAALQYEQVLQDYFSNSPFSFDLLLLGMGDDGHTLSLFPYTEIIHETKRWCMAYFLKQQDMFRISLTKTIANRSACVLFLTTGRSKASALDKVLHGPPDIDQFPAQCIQPEKGEVHWIIDKAAAGK